MRQAPAVQVVQGGADLQEDLQQRSQLRQLRLPPLLRAPRHRCCCRCWAVLRRRCRLLPLLLHKVEQISSAVDCRWDRTRA